MDNLVALGIVIALTLLLILSISPSHRQPQTIYVIQTEEPTDNGWGCLILVLIALFALLLWR